MTERALPLPRAAIFDWDNTLVDTWGVIHDSLNAALVHMVHAPWPYDETRARVLERFEGIGLQIMNRMGGGGPMGPDPISSALSDPAKRRVGAQIIGQAYVVAHNLARENQEALGRIADAPADVAQVHRHAARSLHRLRRRYDLLRRFRAGPALSLFSPR